MAILLNDIGHGANTWPPSKGTHASGGVPGMAEHTFNAAVGREVKRLLTGKLATFEAQAPGGTDVALTTRTTRYNAQHRADRTAIGMSHHGNAGGNKSTRGFGVFYWHTSANGKKLAERILAEYKKEFPGMPIWGTGLFTSRIGDWTNFAILRDTTAPFVLIEWEFFTNDAARRLMLTSDYRNRCARVAARVAANWYGIKLDEPKPQPVPTPPPAPKPEAPKPVVKPAEKPKEDEEMEEKAVVINTTADIGAASLLAEQLRCGLFFRRDAESRQVAKEIYVAGGGKGKIKADKIVDLSGKTRRETAKNVTARF